MNRAAPLLVFVLLAGACSSGGDGAGAADTSSTERAAAPGAGDAAISVDTPAFGFEEPIPIGYSLQGGNTSPEMRWTVTGDEIAELVIVVDDPDTPGDEPFAHWLVAGIGPRDGGVAAGKRPEGAAEGQNSFGRPGYGGPAPPAGETHRYRFQVLALGARSGLQEGFTRSDLEAVLDEHFVVSGETIGIFGA